MSRLIDADAIYPWYMDNFHFDPNEVRFSMNDIRDNLDNIPTHPTPSNTLGALDCVERQAAIEACTDRNGICIAKQRLLELPSVHPDKDLIHLQKEQAYMQGYEDERKPRKGKWTRHFDGNEWYWYCSSCKEQWYEEDLWMGGNSFPNFCPNCGARMVDKE